MLIGILCVTYGVLFFFAITSLLSNWGEEEDKLSRRKKFISGKEHKQEAVEELNSTFYDRFIKPIVDKLTDTFTKINSKSSKDGSKNSSTIAAERLLRLAGKDMSAQAFMFYKNCFMGITILVTLFVIMLLANKLEAMILLLIFLVGIVVAMLLPNMWLRSAASSRQEAIRRQVPDALDLLSICVEAGLSFDSSLLKVSEKFTGPFIDELLIVYREINMGVPRNDALKKLGDATDIGELKTFISALIQANQLGIPINNVMQVQSEQLRETRKQIAKEKGAQAPVKMLLPMVAFIFPVIFIVLMAPTVLNIMEML